MKIQLGMTDKQIAKATVDILNGTQRWWKVSPPIFGLVGFGDDCRVYRRGLTDDYVTLWINVPHREDTMPGTWDTWIQASPLSAIEQRAGRLIERSSYFWLIDPKDLGLPDYGLPLRPPSGRRVPRTSQSAPRTA